MSSKHEWDREYRGKAEGEEKEREAGGNLASGWIGMLWVERGVNGTKRWKIDSWMGLRQVLPGRNFMRPVV